MEPILLEEMKGDSVPRTFEKIYNSFVRKGVRLDRNDYLFLLIHVLMLECGFITVDCREHYDDQDFGFNLSRILDCVDKLPPNWRRSNNVRTAIYFLPPLTQYSCKVTCAECADDIVVNASVEGIYGVNYSFLIDPSRYVITCAARIENKFQDIWHLSWTFKMIIGSPARNAIMKQHKIPAFCLEDLPVEMLLYVMQYFDPVTLAMFERTCTYFRALSHDQILWKKIPGSKWESFQYYKKNENAKMKLSSLLSRSRSARRVD